MTTLPKIAQTSTPLPRKCSVTEPIRRSQTSVSLYGPYPPPHLSNQWDYLQTPPRINPIGPMPPRKRINTSWETIPAHFHNDSRRILMQQREHERYHSAWSKAFYGNPAERESYNKHFREVLKQQMSDQDSWKRQNLINKVQESEQAVEYDRTCLQKDFEDHLTKFNYLKNFRDDNKKLMEKKWEVSKDSQRKSNLYEREIIRYNPINWSCTLK
ncbi:hypothetical protein LOTGIDRAFT_236939 [Lottia gigantea]|uniref:Uncharacterized protein n=1 Tax=Lottia gigantea TaxID=225164 RepID=V3ZEN1_LOTGI|nr:hypothetical protein LOTGIDRAFT_236939 [Lottia gigantea]ESO82552.1 hypothetical protein LOTGIDRAFT_236939 [Lottia gigantea]